VQKRITVSALTMLSITCGAALAAQLTPAQRIGRVTTLLKSLETRDLRPPCLHRFQLHAAQSAGRRWPRIENGKQVEHWDVLETIPPTDQWKNPNSKF
jgi:hypothetical protein